MLETDLSSWRYRLVARDLLWNPGFSGHTIRAGVPTLSPKEGQFSRFGDVSFGYAGKKLRVEAVPAWLARQLEIDGNSEVETSDVGVLLRLTPYNSIDHPGLVRPLDKALRPIGGARFDFSYGAASQSIVARSGALPYPSLRVAWWGIPDDVELHDERSIPKS